MEIKQSTPQRFNRSFSFLLTEKHRTSLKTNIYAAILIVHFQLWYTSAFRVVFYVYHVYVYKAVFTVLVLLKDFDFCY